MGRVNGQDEGLERNTARGVAASEERNTSRGATRMLKSDEVEALLCAAMDGDLMATECLLHHFRPLIVRTAKRYAGVGFEEALQEGYLTMLVAIRSFDPTLGVPFTAYVATKLRGDVRTAMRKLWRYEERIAYSDVAREDEERVDTDLWDRDEGYGFDALDEFDDINLRVTLEMVNLSDRERIAVAGILNGRSCSDLAEQYGVSVETVKTWRKRALRKLRDALGSERELYR